MPIPRLLKVAHITFDMRIGGAERLIYHLIRNTDPSRFEVSLICLNQPLGPFGRELQGSGIPIEECDRRPGLDFSLIKNLHRYLREKGIDIVHCHQYTPFVYGVISGLKTPTRVIFTEHGRFYPDLRKMKRVFVNPALARLCDSITAISAATKEALVRYENMPAKRIRVVYNGIADSVSSGAVPVQAIKKSLGIGENDFILGTVARLDSIKNHPLMIRTLKEIRGLYPQTTLVIIVDVPERGKLESLTRELDQQAHVVFTGFREDAHLFYRLMDVFLLTSFSEGTAMTLLEAMAASLPSVVTDVGGNPEIVKDGETGFVIPSNDKKALVEKIALLQGDESLRRKIGQAARKRFEEKFTVEKMVAAYEQIYEEVARNIKQ